MKRRKSLKEEEDISSKSSFSEDSETESNYSRDESMEEEEKKNQNKVFKLDKTLISPKIKSEIVKLRRLSTEP